MLSDDNGSLGEFDDLMSRRLRVVGRRFLRQSRLTIRAVLVDVKNNDINTIRMTSQAKLAYVTRLPTAFAFELGCAEEIAGGRIEELQEFWLSRACNSRPMASSSSIRRSSGTHLGQSGFAAVLDSLMSREDKDFPV